MRLRRRAVEIFSSSELKQTLYLWRQIIFLRPSATNNRYHQATSFRCCTVDERSAFDFPLHLSPLVRVEYCVCFWALLVALQGARTIRRSRQSISWPTFASTPNDLFPFHGCFGPFLFLSECIYGYVWYDTDTDTNYQYWHWTIWDPRFHEQAS